MKQLDCTEEEYAACCLLLACKRSTGNVLFDYDRVGRDELIAVYPAGLDGRDMDAIELGTPGTVGQLHDARRAIERRAEVES